MLVADSTHVIVLVMVILLGMVLLVILVRILTAHTYVVLVTLMAGSVHHHAVAWEVVLAVHVVRHI